MSKFDTFRIYSCNSDSQTPFVASRFDLNATNSEICTFFNEQFLECYSQFSDIGHWCLPFLTVYNAQRFSYGNEVRVPSHCKNINTVILEEIFTKLPCEQVHHFTLDIKHMGNQKTKILFQNLDIFFGSHGFIF